MNVPPFLFKYTTPDTAKIILTSGRIRWSSPDIFNDPAEFQRLPAFCPTLKESMDIVPRLLLDAAEGHADINVEQLCQPTRRLYDLACFVISNGMKRQDLLAGAPDEHRPLDDIYEGQLRNFFGANFTKHARVLCLTANPLNPVMWANYADTHTGCLLEFCHLPEFDTPLQEAKPVAYTAAAPCIGSGVDMILYNSAELRGKTIDAICFTKRKEWEYEQEWRVVNWRSNEGDALHGDYPFFPRELASVTFGLRATEEDVAEISALVKSAYSHASLYKVVAKHGDLSRVDV